MKISIRNEKESDHRKVEELTREAFWNLYVPGCDEHYLVHVMRNHDDFLSELNFVAVVDNQIVGNIMYAKSHLINSNDSTDKLDTITFGPVSVLPEFQKQGVGSALIKHSIKVAKKAGYNAIIIQGHPYNYCKHGFKGSKTFDISNSEGKYPFSSLTLELETGIFSDKKWSYHSSDVYDLDQAAADEFDKLFDPKKKEYRYTQEEFSIACSAFV